LRAETTSKTWLWGQNSKQFCASTPADITSRWEKRVQPATRDAPQPWPVTMTTSSVREKAAAGGGGGGMWATRPFGFQKQSWVLTSRARDESVHVPCTRYGGQAARTQIPSHCPFTGDTGSECTGVENEESREKIMNIVTAEVHDMSVCVGGGGGGADVHLCNKHLYPRA
jgi:hypothetical protein